MNKKFWTFLFACLVSTPLFSEEMLDKKIKSLEKDVLILKEKTALWDRFRFNGFFTIGVYQSNNNLGYLDSSDEYDFYNLSILGLQNEFLLSADTSFIVQIVGRGSDDFSPDFEWAYLKHTFDNYVTMKGGKLRVPFYMYSDYLEVGFAQPWANPPDDVYGFVPFNSYLGVDVSYDFEFDESTLQVQAFVGQSEEDGDIFQELIGANVSWVFDEITLRAIAGETKITVDEDAASADIQDDNNPADFIGFGAIYDNGTLLAVSEITRAQVDGAYPDVATAYVTLGYRVNNLMPYISVSGMETIDNEEREDNPALSIPYTAKRRSYSLGVRYELLSNLTVKADVTRVSDFGDTNGLLESKVLGDVLGYETDDGSNVFSLVFEGVF